MRLENRSASACPGMVGTSGVPTGVVAADGSPVVLACPYGTPPDTGPSAQDAQEVAAGYADWVLAF